MLVLAGLFVVLGCVAGGFAMHRGPFTILWQPSEFVIIGGAALGSVLIAAPVHVLRQMGRGLVRVVRGSADSRETTVAMLVSLFRLIRIAAYEGANGLEPHVEHPDESSVFRENPDLLADSQTVEFFCDTAKVIIIGGVPEHQIAELTDLSLETHQSEANEPVDVLARVADSLPGLGIVAAVLGIIVTMQKIDGDPAEIGQSVAAALVGTFLGVLMAYGIVGPLAGKLSYLHGDSHHRMNCVRAVVLAYARGLHPLLCVEFGRRTLPSHLRPGFSQLELACREKSGP